MKSQFITCIAVCLIGAPAWADEPEKGDAWAKIAPYFTPPAEFAGDTGGYASPLRSSDGRPVETAEQWTKRRAEIRQEWHEMLGPWPPLLEKPKVEFLEQERRENFTQHHVKVEVAPRGQQSDGYLLVPDGQGPFPAVLVVYYEAKTCIGRGETGEGSRDFGLQLARRGFVTLSIGTPSSTNEGKDTREALVQSGGEYPLQPLSFLAYVAANCHTVLAQRPEVDPQRIGMVGHSYGGKWTMFASCLYDKFACAVWCDPGIVFDESNSNVNYWEPWYLGYEPGVKRKPGRPTRRQPAHRAVQEAGRGEARPARAARADGAAAVPRLRRIGGQAPALEGAQPDHRRQQAAGLHQPRRHDQSPGTHAYARGGRADQRILCALLETETVAPIRR